MPTNVCVNANIVGGILPTLPKKYVYSVNFTKLSKFSKVPRLVKMAGKMPAKVCMNADVRAAFYPPYRMITTYTRMFYKERQSVPENPDHWKT